jgi:integrase/recombinase XerD
VQKALLDTQSTIKIESATEGLKKWFITRLENHEHKANALTIANFLIAAKIESNIAISYKEDLIFTLCKLSNYVGKDFINFTREDILSYLDSYRKTEAKDPMHSWIGSYNLHRVFIMKFFRWFYSPDMEPKDRAKPTCIENIPQLKRKEKSIYKPTDLWTPEDDLLFLKYCRSKRDRCYHAVSRDLSCRPHELLKLRIKDVVFKMAGDRQYAEILVSGKTGQRHIPLINSIPYLKDWLDDHPLSGIPTSPLICGFGKSLGRAISPMTLHGIYIIYKTKLFPKLLKDPSISPEDKNKIRELLKKPWNPYIRRHSALTDKSKILREHVLRQHAGWSPGSNMHLKYLHYFGNESSESILEAYGLKPKAEEIDTMKPKLCPNCTEPNKPDSKFCAKCRMVLSYDAYTETVDAKEEKESQVKELQQKYEKDMKEMRELMEKKFNQIFEKIDLKKIE